MPKVSEDYFKKKRDEILDAAYQVVMGKAYLLRFITGHYPKKRVKSRWHLSLLFRIR